MDPLTQIEDLLPLLTVEQLESLKSTIDDEIDAKSGNDTSLGNYTETLVMNSEPTPELEAFFNQLVCIKSKRFNRPDKHYDKGFSVMFLTSHPKFNGRYLVYGYHDQTFIKHGACWECPELVAYFQDSDKLKQSGGTSEYFTLQRNLDRSYNYELEFNNMSFFEKLAKDCLDSSKEESDVETIAKQICYVLFRSIPDMFDEDIEEMIKCLA